MVFGVVGGAVRTWLLACDEAVEKIARVDAMRHIKRIVVLFVVSIAVAVFFARWSEFVSDAVALLMVESAGAMLVVAIGATMCLRTGWWRRPVLAGLVGFGTATGFALAGAVVGGTLEPVWVASGCLLAEGVQLVWVLSVFGRAENLEEAGGRLMQDRANPPLLERQGGLGS